MKYMFRMSETASTSTGVISESTASVASSSTMEPDFGNSPDRHIRMPEYAKAHPHRLMRPGMYTDFSEIRMSTIVPYLPSGCYRAIVQSLGAMLHNIQKYGYDVSRPWLKSELKFIADHLPST